MMSKVFKLLLLPFRLAICRLEPQEGIPAWATVGSFFSISRTSDELSIVCPEELAPAEGLCDAGWRAFKLVGPFDLQLVGVLAAVVAPLAEADISVFALATYDTDYLLIKKTQLEQAIAALSAAGHKVNI
jgi:hypothetical protein